MGVLGRIAHRGAMGAPTSARGSGQDDGFYPRVTGCLRTSADAVAAFNEAAKAWASGDVYAGRDLNQRALQLADQASRFGDQLMVDGESLHGRLLDAAKRASALGADADARDLSAEAGRVVESLKSVVAAQRAVIDAANAAREVAVSLVFKLQREGQAERAKIADDALGRLNALLGKVGKPDTNFTGIAVAVGLGFLGLIGLVVATRR